MVQATQNSIESRFLHLVKYNLLKKTPNPLSIDFELTTHQLKNLAEAAEKIEEPILFGKFNSDIHYLETLNLVLSSTYETINRGNFFLNKILPLVVTKNRLLDVGPGNGEITKLYINQFKHITAIDINDVVLKNLNSIIPKGVDFIKLSASLLDVELPFQSFDLSVLSHVLYYIDPTKWMAAIDRVYKSTSPKGVMAIVLSGDSLGKANLITHFNGQIMETDKLAEDCINSYGASNIKLYASDESFITSSLTALLHIAGFMLYDANVSATKEELSAYIKRNFYKPKGFFEMTTRQKYILITK